MNWKWLFIVGLGLLIIFLMFFKKSIKQKNFFKIKPWQSKALHFATPHRMELIALSLYFIFFFIADLAQNKFLDLGTDYSVIVLWNMTAPAILVWQIFLILFHLALVWLFIMSLKSKATNKFYDLIVGVSALFAVGILLAGVINQIHADSIYFLGMTFESIDFYHLGVYVEMFAGIYWAFTK